MRFHESDVIYSEARERSRFGMRRRGRTKTKQLLPIVVYTEHEGKDIEKANLNHSMVQKLMKLKRTNSKEINSPRLEDDNEDVDLENIDTEKYHALLQKQKISNKKPSPRMRSFEEDLKRLEELRDSARVSRVPTPASLRGSTSTTPTSSAKNSPSKPLVAKDDAIAALYENVVEHKEDDSTSNRNSGGVATPHQQHLLDLGEEIQLLHDEYDDDEDDDEDDEGIIYVGGSSNKYVRHDSVMLRKEDNSNKVYYDDYDDYDAEDIVSYDEIEDKESSESRITTTNTKVNSAPSYAPTTSSAGKASSQFAIPLLALNSFSGNATNSMSKDASPYTSPRLSLEGFNADGSSSVPAVKYKPHRLSGSQNDLNVGIAEHQTAIQSSSSIISETIRLQGEAMNRLSIGSSNSKMSSEEGSKSSSTSSSSRNSTPSHSRSGSGSFPPLPPQQTSSSEVNALQKYVPYELSEEDSLRLMLLLSHQENVYGIHMFDALNLTDPFSDDNDDVRQVQREKRLDTPHQYEEAVKIVFERKFGKPITPIKKVSTTTTISSSTSLGNLEKLDNTNGSDNLNHISGSRSSVGSSSTTSVSYPQQQGAVVVEDYNTRPLSSSINSNVVGDNNGVTGGLAAANAINDGSGLFRMRNNFQIPPIYIPPASTSFGSGNVSSANTPSYGNTPHAIAGNPYAGNTPHANSYAQTQSNMSNAAQHASSGKRTPSLYNSNMPPSIPSSSGHGNGKFPLATDGQQHQSGVRRSQIPLPPATSTPTAGSTNGVKYYNGTNSTTSSIYGNTVSCRHQHL